MTSAWVWPRAAAGSLGRRKRISNEWRGLVAHGNVRGTGVLACSVGWFVSLLVREEVLLAGLCERKILFRLEIYDRLRQATAKQTVRNRLQH